MFRTFEFFSVIYFLAISANFFLVWHLYKSLFRLKRLYDKVNFLEPSKNNRNYYKYVQSLWIRRYKEMSKKIIPDKKSRDSAAFFGRIEKLKPIAIKHLVFFLMVVIIYLLMVGTSLFVLFFLLEKPLIYGVVAWVQHISHVAFYLLVFVLGARLPSYRKAINDTIDSFEDENDCKVRIINELQLFEINWAPKLFESRISEPKKIAKFLKGDEEDNIRGIDSEIIRIKKIDVKEGKAKKFTYKVSPL